MMKARVCFTNEELSRVLTRDDLQWVIDRTIKKDVPTHAEAVFLQPFCVGLTVDIGCGAEKVAPSVLGIDKLAYGERGQFGCMNGTPSAADISADGGDLYFIAEGTLDSVVSRHSFEHLPDPMATLREWLRILKKGGLLSLVCPDDHFQDFLNMDKDHKFRCYPNTVTDALESLNRYGGGAKGEMVEVGRAVIPGWSFFAQIRRV